MTWAEGLEGVYSDIAVDPFFISHGVSFVAQYINTSGAGSLVLTSVPASGVPGDYNGDLNVDAADYIVWRKTDSNNPAGYQQWRSHFGNVTPGSGAGASLADGVETQPNSLALLVLSVFSSICWRHRR